MREKEFVHAFKCIALAFFSVLLLTSPKKSISQNDKRPNILFIMTDQQFGDAMSCRMGKEYINTPAMDALAENGVLFSRAYSPNPLCTPARNSIFTGRYPHETGIQSNGKSDKKFDIKEFVSMGNYFRNAGYETAYFGKWHLHFNSKDIEQHGFQITGEIVGRGADDKIRDSAVKYLSSKPKKPFIAVVSLSNPHDVCQLSRDKKLPSGPIPDISTAKKLPPVPVNLQPTKNEPETMTVIRTAYQAEGSLFPVGDFSDKKWQEYRWGYYRLVEKVDSLIGDVMTSLKESGLEENTLVIFTSDHGECAGAHSFNQKTVFYEESVRVPLIISQKGKTKKSVTNELINTGIDILPTMLDFAGIEIPKKFPGNSLKPILENKKVSDWRNYVVSQNYLIQTMELEEFGFNPTSQGRMVRSDRFKYCVYQFGETRESLYDLQNDPMEMTNLAVDSKYKKVVMEHREMLKEFSGKYNDNLIVNLLANDVAPIAFKKDISQQKK